MSPMATPKLFVFSIFSALLFVIVVASKKSPLEPEDTVSSLRIELEQLKTKVSLLESTIEKSDNKLRSKDDDIKQMENVILEKSQSIASLKNKIEALQQKESLDVKREVNGPHSHVAELEKQVDRLKEEIEAQETRKIGLKAQANEAQKKIQQLNIELENLQKVSYEQMTGIHMTEEALQVAEEEMIKVEPAATFTKSLKSLIVAQWKYFWRPALDTSFPKILVKLSQVRREGEMYIEMLKTEWIPVMKDQWLPFISSLSSHFESLTTKIIEAYHVTKNSLLSNTVKIQTAAAPFIQERIPVMNDQWLTFLSSLTSHYESLTPKIIEAYHVTKNSLLSNIVKIQTAAAPFIQEAHKFAKPYINQIETVTKPYTDMDEVTLQHYSRKPVWAYRTFVTSVISYHNQVQQWLKTNELTRSLASIELAWFAATVLLCLPVVCLCRLYSAIFRKNGRKLGRISHSNNIRRKLKRPRNFD